MKNMEKHESRVNYIKIILNEQITSKKERKEKIKNKNLLPF
jgi:hypothetical protein